MFRHGACSTEVDRNAFVYTLVTTLVSLTVSLSFLFLGKGKVLSILVFLGFLVLAACGGIVLFGMLTDYAYIEEERLTMRYLFKKADINLKDIGCIKLEENVYTVYDRQQTKRGTINAMALGIDNILKELDRNSVPFA